MNTLKTLIVDDEILVAKLLSQSVDWSKLDIESPEIVTSVDAALTLLEEKSFDIIFTDIHMPIINGLDFAREVKKNYPYIQIIVVTGYDDFEYAKTSVHIGVLEYIQKPIQPLEIYNAVLRAKDNILQRRKNVQEYAQLREQLFSNLEYLRERLLNKLILGDLEYTHVSQQLQQYDIVPLDSALQVSVVELLPLKSRDISILMNFTQIALKLIKGQFECDNERYAFLDAEQRIVLLSFSQRFDLYEYANNAKTYLSTQLPCTVHIGIGNIYDWHSHYEDSYKEAIVSLNALHGNLESSVAEIGNLHQRHQLLPDECIKTIAHLQFLIQSGLVEKTKETLDNLYETFQKINTDISTVKTAAVAILSGITQTILLSGLEGYNAFFEQQNIQAKIYQSEDLYTVFVYLSDYISDIGGKISQRHRKEERQSLNHIKQYLLEHMSENSISLSAVSRKFGYNQSYLSRLFKKETGSTFSDYLFTLRMDHAIKLVRNSELRSYQIAEQVGFIDANYFSTCFKKYTGLTVLEYRQQK